MSLVIVDSAQAWRVTIGCFIINGLMVGFMKVFSLIMVEYHDILEAPMSFLLFGASMMNSLVGISGLKKLNIGLLSNYLSEKITTQKFGILAAALATVSTLILAFSYHIVVYIFATVLLGFAFSFVYIPTYSLPGKCHIKHQTLSQGIVTAGASFGTLVMPLVLAQIIDTYSIRGYIFIIAGILLHFAVGAALMPTHIVSFTDRRKPTYLMCQDDFEDNYERNKKLGNLKIYHHSSNMKRNVVWPPRNVLPSLIIYSVGMGFIMNGYMILSGLFGAFSRSFDLDIATSAYILIGHSCLDLISRLLIGFIVDKKICERYILYSVSAITLGAITILASLVPHIILFYVYVVSNAVFGSIIMVLHILVLSDVVGIANISSSFSVYIFIQGGMAIITFYGVGKICDVFESYDYGVLFAGIMLLLGAFFILIELFVKKSDNV